MALVARRKAAAFIQCVALALRLGAAQGGAGAAPAGCGAATLEHAVTAALEAVVRNAPLGVAAAVLIEAGAGRRRAEVRACHHVTQPGALVGVTRAAARCHVTLGELQAGVLVQFVAELGAAGGANSTAGRRGGW